MSSSEWKVIKLGEFCTKIGSGITPRGGENVYKSDGISLIRSQNIYDYYFDYNGLVFIDDEQANKMKNVEVKAEDVLLNITGDSVARCCIIPEEVLPARVNQHVSIIRPKKEFLNPRYLLYFFNSFSTKELLMSLASAGGTRKALTKSMIENLNIKVPNMIEQEAIVNTLSCLDDKIELNNRISKNLEEMAQAIFKSWFVDFEPFQDGNFEDGELGRTPKGWKVVAFEDVFNFQEGPGIRNWQYVTENGTKFINIRCIQNNDLQLDTANMISDDEANGKYSHFMLKEWDVVVSSSGTLGRYAIVRKEHLPLCLNTSVIRFFPKEKFEHFSYMFGYLTSQEFYDHLITKACGSVQANFGPMHLRQIKLIFPSEEILLQYHGSMFPLFKKCVQLRSENQTLTDLRNTLLSKLISGEIRVPIEEVQ